MGNLKNIPWRNKNIAALILSVTCFIVIVITLNVPSRVGIANNGDFLRIITPARITYINGESNRWVRFAPTYKMALRDGKVIRDIILPDYSTFKYLTSQTAIVKASMAVNALVNLITGNDINHYDLLYLGIIHAFIYALSVFFITRFVLHFFGSGAYIVSSAILLFVFCDQGYTLYYNSFFSEQTQFVFTFLSIGLYLLWLEQKNLITVILYYTSVLCMAFS